MSQEINAALTVLGLAVVGAGGLLAQTLVGLYHRNRPVAVRRRTRCACNPKASISPRGKTAFDLTECARTSTAVLSLAEYISSLQDEGDIDGVKVGQVLSALFRRVPGVLPFDVPFASLLSRIFGPANMNRSLGYDDIFRALSSFSPTILSLVKECQARAMGAAGLSPSLFPADAVEAGKLPPHAYDLTFPNPFLLSRITAHVAQWPDRYPAQPEIAAPPTELDPVLLPDLCFGFAGLEWSSPHQYQVDQVMTALCNRLAANLTPELVEGCSRPVCSSAEGPMGSSTDGTQQGAPTLAGGNFALVLEEGGRPLYRFDDFIEALLGAGHQVTCKVMHHAAVFGIGLCVRQPDATFANIPVACFQQLGFLKSKSGDEAVLPLHHAAVVFEVQGPLLSFSLAFYHSINGLVGFHPLDGMRCPWNPGRVVQSASGTDALVWARALTLCIPVLSTYATRCGLPSGGYGLVGVCTDSVALVQHAVTGATDEYPCLGRAEHRRAMRTLFFSAAQGLRPREAPGLPSLLRESDREVLLSFACSLPSLPCDLGGTPANLLDCCRRIGASVPYPSGKETFESTVEALGIVREVMAQQSNLIPAHSD